MGALFGDANPAPAPARTVMPDEQDPSVLAARKRQYEIATQRSGRAATILSDAFGKDRLGGNT
jgi:hypothetical protein